MKCKSASTITPDPLALGDGPTDPADAQNPARREPKVANADRLLGGSWDLVYMVKAYLA